MPVISEDILTAISEGTWPSPNYVDPVTRRWLPAFMLVWLIVATILLGGRFYLRMRRLAGAFGLDDLLIGLGWLFSIGMTVAIWLDVVHYGLDRHTWDNKVEWAVGAAMYGWMGQVFFIASTVCTKLSVLLFHRRMIKETVDAKWLWALRADFAFTSCYGVGVLLAYFLTCQPLDALWLAYSGTYNKPYKCLNGSEIAVVAGVLSVVSDLAAVLLPCLMLNHYNLDISRRQKVVLNVTFGLGMLATGAGIARSYYLWKIQHTSDTTWTGHDLFTWSVIECQLAIICACAPSLRAFFRRYFLDSLKRSFSGCSHYAQSSSGRSNKNSLPTLGTMTTSQHDGRGGFRELKELESGVHGVAYPPPVILGDERDSITLSPVERGDRTTWQSAEILGDSRIGSTKSPSPKIRTPEEYESYAMERLSRHGTMVRERQSRTESIVVRMEEEVDQGSVPEKRVMSVNRNEFMNA